MSVNAAAHVAVTPARRKLLMTVQVTAPQTHTPIPDLDPLTVVPMTGDYLDSFKTIKENFRALIPRAKLLSSDKFYVEIVGEPGTPKEGDYKSPELLLGTLNPRTLNLDKKTVAFHLGKKMTVTYTIIRDGEGEKTSPPLELNVLPLPKSELKAARILEAQDEGDGDELDLTGSTVDLTLHLKNWPLIAEKQRCWIDLLGKNAGGEEHSLPVLQSAPVDKAWTDRGYRAVKVPYNYFRELLDGSPLKVIVKVALNQEDDETQAFDFEERLYTVRNVAVEKPVITKVTDSKDVPVADNGETTDTTLKLEGTAGVGETVEIFVGADSDDTVPAVDGTWKYELTRLSQDTHVIKVVTSGQSSNTWTVTVKALVVKPTIDEVKDSAGAPISNPGTTTKTPLKLTGTVAAGKKVRIYNGATPLGEGKSTGAIKWEFDTLRLLNAEYVFTAEGQYDDKPKSAPWTVTVNPNDAPEWISSVEADGVRIEDGASVRATGLRLSGQLPPSSARYLEIWDHAFLLDTIPVQQDQRWSYGFRDMSPKDYSFTVKVPGGSTVSKPFRVTVLA
jgi:hypothetical protein